MHQAFACQSSLLDHGLGLIPGRQRAVDAPIDYMEQYPVYAEEEQPDMISNSRAWRIYLSEAAVFDEVLEEQEGTADLMILFTALFSLTLPECDETIAPYMLTDSETSDEEDSFSWECFDTTPPW